MGARQRSVPVLPLVPAPRVERRASRPVGPSPKLNVWVRQRRHARVELRRRRPAQGRDGRLVVRDTRLRLAHAPARLTPAPRSFPNGGLRATHTAGGYVEQQGAATATLLLLYCYYYYSHYHYSPPTTSLTPLASLSGTSPSTRRRPFSCAATPSSSQRAWSPSPAKRSTRRRPSCAPTTP